MPHDSELTDAQASNLRLLKAIVIILGGLTLLALVVLVSTIVWRLNAGTGEPTPVTGAPPVVLRLPAGAEVRGTGLDGSRLAVHLQGDREEILIVDADSGAILSRVVIERVP